MGIQEAKKKYDASHAPAPLFVFSIISIQLTVMLDLGLPLHKVPPLFQGKEGQNKKNSGVGNPLGINTIEKLQELQNAQ